MNREQFIAKCATAQATTTFVEFSDEEIGVMTPEIAEELIERFHSTLFMRLAPSEIRFFEWLKQFDEKVWHDLWDEADIEPYLVGISLLPQLLVENRGFPICDLVDEPNFYFSIKHLATEEATHFLDALQRRVEAGEKLRDPEFLMMEIRRAPIDIWRFAYLYGLSLHEARASVIQLVEDNVLLYASDREELSGFLELS